MNTTPIPTKPKKQSRLNWKYITPALTLVAGIALGAAAMTADGPEASASTPPPKPERIVETETVEVEVLRVPGSCLNALDDADELIDVNFDLLEMLLTLYEELPGGFEAAAAWDSVGLEHMTGVITGINADVDKITERVGKNTYGFTSSECRIAGS